MLRYEINADTRPLRKVVQAYKSLQLYASVSILTRAVCQNEKNEGGNAQTTGCLSVSFVVVSRTMNTYLTCRPKGDLCMESSQR